MRKIEIIDLIKKSPQIKDQFHDATVEYNISLAYEQMLFDATAQGLRNFSLHTKKYNMVEVKKADTGYYADLPESIINLPRPLGGLHTVYLSANNKVRFAPVSTGSQEIFQELDVAVATDMIYYTLVNDQVLFTNIDDSIRTVDMELIIPFEKFEDNDTVHIPASRSQTLAQLVTQYLLNQPKELNDN